MKWPLFSWIILLGSAWTIQAKPTIPLSIHKETTFATEPVDSEGRVDYVAALNDRLRKGVTPENNANVLLWQALGPKVGSSAPQFLELMGVKPLPEKGDYFIPVKPSLSQALTQATQWPWKEEEYPDLAKWLKENEIPLALVEEASQRPRFYFPIVPQSTDRNTPRLMDSLLPMLSEYLALANALKCRAMQKIGAGDDEGAWKDLQTLQRLGRLKGQGPYLIDVLIGISFVRQAHEGELILLGAAQPSAKQARAWLAESSRLSELPKFADKWEIGERFMSLDLLQSIAHGYRLKPTFLKMEKNHLTILEQSSRGKVDWDVAFRKVNREIDRTSRISRLPSYRERVEATAKEKEDTQSLRDKIKALDPKSALQLDPKGRGDLIGDAYVTMNGDTPFDHDYPEFRIQQLQRNAQIALALAVYKAEHGKYPAQLADLAPKYLKQVPDDLFSGKPLIYKPSEKGYLLYSVGKNGKDDGGIFTQIDQQDDLVARMPSEQPKPIDD